MTLITPIETEDDAARLVLEAAEEHYQRTVIALQELIHDITQGRSARAKELKPVLRELGHAVQAAFDERSRVEKRLRTQSGVVHDYALDFDAARDEIGRRLACLRDAQGTGTVSGGAE